MAQTQEAQSVDKNMLRFSLNLEQRTWWIHCKTQDSNSIVSIEAFPSIPVDAVPDSVKRIIEYNVGRMGYTGTVNYKPKQDDSAQLT